MSAISGMDTTNAEDHGNQAVGSKEGTASRGIVSKASTGIIVAAILLWRTPINDIFNLIALAAAAAGYVVPAFLVAVVVYFVVELTASMWIDGNWDRWMAGAREKTEQRLAKWRQGRIMKHLVNGVTGDSIFWYAVAAALTSPIMVVTIGRFIGGQPIGKSRILWAVVANALFQAGLIAVVGLLLNEGAEALF